MVNKLLFDFRGCGMGNNGGTSTVVKSVNTLTDLGFEVVVIDGGRNQHTWTKLKCEHLIPKNNYSIPSADAIIATGYKTVKHVANAPDRLGIKLHWIRAWETWQMPEKAIIEKVLKQNTYKIVNSICLQRKLKQVGFDSIIIRPGYDLNEYSDLGYRKFSGSRIILGGLYNKRHNFRKNSHWIINATKKLKAKKYPVKLWLFGDEEKPNDPVVDLYLRRPNTKEKVKFYSNINIWLAPTNSEGLHMPPAEAMLTGACVVATNAELSGVQDYLIDGLNGLYSNQNEESFFKTIEKLVKDIELQKRLCNNAAKEVSKLCCREANMLKLVRVIKNAKEGIFERINQKCDSYFNCEDK